MRALLTFLFTFIVATSLSAHVVPPLTQAKAFLEAESRAIRAETRRLSQHLRKQREAVQDALHQLRRACAAVETGEVSVDPWLADLRLRDTLKVLEHEEKVVASNIGVLYARLEQLDIRATGRLKDSIVRLFLLFVCAHQTMPVPHSSRAARHV